MAGSRNQNREARERLRRYHARQQLHERQQRRRRRDNLTAALGVLVVASLATITQLAYFSSGPGALTPSPSASPSSGASSGEVPSPELAENRRWSGQLVMAGTTLQIELDGAAAPQAVSSFVSLTRSGFYEGTSCHRLTSGEDFRVLQCGDPAGDGTGGPGYRFGPIENAPEDDRYPAGTIAMARQSGDADSMGSQFFIVYGDSTIPADEAGGYTVLGRITSGLDRLTATVTDAGTADGSLDGAPAVEARITSVAVR